MNGTINRSRKAIFAFVTILIIILIVISTLWLSRVPIEELVSKDFFANPHTINVEEIDDTQFIELELSELQRSELVSLFAGETLNNTKISYSALDADYRIFSQENQIYIFVEEEIVVFSNDSSSGYKFVNDEGFFEDLMKIVE